MRFEVPQFIEVEDKIFGPFTWKQFIYLAGGAAITLISYFLLPFMLFVLVGLLAMGLAASLAFQQVNSRPFADFLESAVQFLFGAKLYLWKRSATQTITAPSKKTVVAPQISLSHTSHPKENLNSLSRKLELNTLTPQQTKEYADTQ